MLIGQDESKGASIRRPWAAEGVEVWDLLSRGHRPADTLPEVKGSHPTAHEGNTTPVGLCGL